MFETDLVFILFVLVNMQAFSEVKRPDREAENSPPSRKNAWSFACTSWYVSQHHSFEVQEYDLINVESSCQIRDYFFTRQAC
jgi:hypothetical protein